jgi:hypothetical protein
MRLYSSYGLLGDSVKHFQYCHKLFLKKLISANILQNCVRIFGIFVKIYVFQTTLHCLVLTAMFWPSCSRFPVLVVLSWPSFPALRLGCPVLEVSIPEVLHRLSCPSSPVPGVLSLLSCSGPPILSVLSGLTCQTDFQD